MSRTLLALHAHPDDESSKGAGTVARYAAAGVRCILVTATGGEAGDVLNPALDTPDVHARLPELRRAELGEAVRIIGFDRVELLGYRDSGMPDSPHNAHPDAFANADYAGALEAVVRLVRKEQPQVLLGYDEHREGETESEPLACGACSKPVAEEETFCPHCGARFEDAG